MPGRRLPVLIGASYVLVLGFLSWRARKRAKSAADQAEGMVADGPIIDFENSGVCQSILASAKERASKWLSYQVSGADHMVGQVGGVSAHKRPLLTLDPDYVLKPLQVDHRGIRELAFYEALNAAAHTSGMKAYAAFTSVKGTSAPGIFDLVAFSLALLSRDSYVLDCERRILAAWDAVEIEAKLMQRLYRFVPSFFGLVQHEILSSTTEEAAPKEQASGRFGIHLDNFLLLQDITVNFTKPCVIDLKLGCQTYEPDAPMDKKQREQSKYPQQDFFGFRIVAKRIYLPSHKDAGDNGFVFYPKNVGRSLSSREGLKDAFVTYFGLETVNPSLLPFRLKAITNVLLKLRSLKHWFRDNTSFRFIASSLLISYEGATDESENLDMVHVKMIDFGHVRRDCRGDPGYLKGLNTIAAMLEEISTEWREKYRQGIGSY